jgi:hypothetical protein
MVLAASVHAGVGPRHPRPQLCLGDGVSVFRLAIELHHQSQRQRFHFVCVVSWAVIRESNEVPPSESWSKPSGVLAGDSSICHRWASDDVCFIRSEKETHARFDAEREPTDLGGHRVDIPAPVPLDWTKGHHYSMVDCTSRFLEPKTLDYKPTCGFTDRKHLSYL